jgi:hypothetical protein
MERGPELVLEEHVDERVVPGRVDRGLGAVGRHRAVPPAQPVEGRGGHGSSTATARRSHGSSVRACSDTTSRCMAATSSTLNGPAASSSSVMRAARYPGSQLELMAGLGLALGNGGLFAVATKPRDGL